jgi:hypothetical protein
MLMITEIENNIQRKKLDIAVNSIYSAHLNFNNHHFIVSEVHFFLTL